ncbi:hypothetical protein Amsp01_013570 [Amycolatopsis sp. NBRC 101858]|nr:hypothetical protein Amsp01_013570 [Amycolatopsis sp. NBRC 101858]
MAVTGPATARLDELALFVEAEPVGHVDGTGREFGARAREEGVHHLDCAGDPCRTWVVLADGTTW